MLEPEQQLAETRLAVASALRDVKAAIERLEAHLAEEERRAAGHVEVAPGVWVRASDPERFGR